MRYPKLERARLTVCALAVLALVACGGNDTTNPSVAGSSSSEAVQISDTDAKLAVQAPGMPAAGGGAPVTAQWAAMKYTFKATSAAGAALPWSGMLMLRSENEGGATELEGRLIPATAAPPASAASPVAMALAEMRERIDALRRAFVTAVEAALVKFRADLAAATTDAQRAAAREAFATAFKALVDKLHKDVAAVAAETAERLAALGIKDPAAAMRGERRGRGDGRRALEVEGTVSAAGAVKLRIELGDDQIVQATGTMAADGSMTGTFTGPAANDTGKWSATLGAAAAPPPPAASAPPPPTTPAPPPPPPPPATADAAAGATKYAASCASCHGADPKANRLNVLKATSVAALDAAIAGVGAMRNLAGTLSAKDKLDIVAFINK